MDKVNVSGLSSLRAGSVVLCLCASALLTGCGLSGTRGSVTAGEQFIAAGKYRAAYIEAKKVLQRNDKDGSAWALLGESSLMLGNPRDAVSELENARKNGVPAGQWAVPLGRAMLILQHYNTLLRTLDASQVQAPAPRARVEVLRGEAYLALRQPDAAKQSFESALAVNAKDSGALVGLARLAASQDDLESANNYVQRAVEANAQDPEAWIFRGDLAFAANDFAGAESDYEKALGLKSTDLLPQEQFYARARLADAQTRQDQFAAALTNIATLEKMAPEQPYPHYLHAVVFYKQGHLDDATAQLHQVLKAVPDSAPAQMLLGAVNYAQGNYGQAEMYLSNVIGLDPKSVEAQKLLALTLYREGRSHEALTTLRAALPGKPTDAALLAMLQQQVTAGAALPGASAEPAATGVPGEFAPAGQALASGDAAEAIRLLKALPPGAAGTQATRESLLVLAYLRESQVNEAVKTSEEYASKNPSDSAAHLLYGTALIAAGKRNEARAQYETAYKLDPKNLAALMNLGSLDAEGHDYGAAAAHYQAVLKIDSNNTDALTALGEVAMLQGDTHLAESRFKQAIQSSPKAGAAYLRLLSLYAHTGRLTDAVAIAKQYVAAAPADPAALNALGSAQLDARAYPAALAPLAEAVKEAPQKPLYRLNLARAQIFNKQDAEAEKNLRQVVASAPDLVMASALLAFLKLQDGDLPAALNVARTLQKRPATRAAGYSLEGDLYMNRKQYLQAAAAYQAGLGKDYTRPLAVKAFFALNSSRSPSADRILQDWLTKHPDDGGVHLLLAQYYLDHSHNKLAEEQYQQTLASLPANVDALNNLAWLYTQSGDARALATATRAYKLAPQSPSVQDTYGWALVKSGQPAEALPILAHAAKAAPGVLAIQYHLAVAEVSTGSKAEAKTTLATLLKQSASFEGKADAERLFKELGGR